MLVKKLKIGNTHVDNNVFLAPIAGYTDYCFRNLIIEEGAGLTFTELVSAKGLCYAGKGSFELLYTGGNEEKTAVQLFGHEPYYMRSAIESEALKDFKIVDINMGCPVPKVFKNGDGSALLKSVHIAKDLLSECVKTGKDITIKIRTGINRGEDVASEFCKMAEDVGVKAVTVHGRVREDYYSGEPDFKAIERAKNSVSIPIIANGGIFTEEDADNMIDKTGADGVMIARGAMANPFIFSEILGTNPKRNLKEFILKQLELMEGRYGDKRTAALFRKFVPYYFKNFKNVKEFRLSLMESLSVKELKEKIEGIF